MLVGSMQDRDCVTTLGGPWVYIYATGLKQTVETRDVFETNP